jgi:hypothetical protein
MDLMLNSANDFDEVIYVTLHQTISFERNGPSGKEIQSIRILWL